MATVTIHDSDARDGMYPPSCVVCGTDTDRPQRQKFHWLPPSARVLVVVFGVLGGIIGALIASSMKRTKEVVLPVCPDCNGHWWNQTVRLIGGVLGGFFVMMVGAASERQLGKGLSGGLLLCGFLVLLLSGFAAVFFRGVHATEITDHTVTLKGVSDEFAEGFEANLAEGPAGPDGVIDLKRADGGVELQMQKYMRQ